MIRTLRPLGLSRVVPPEPTLFLRWRFWPEQLLPSSAFLPTCGRLRAILTAARRLAAVARATDPQADGPGFFESTSTSCVPLYATEPADEPADEPACHARRIRESAGREKLNDKRVISKFGFHQNVESNNRQSAVFRRFF